MQRKVSEIVRKGVLGDSLSGDELAVLFGVPLFSMESMMILSAARQKSEKASGGMAEVHGQVGLNIAPCVKNCKFCAFATCNKVFDASAELSLGEAKSRALDFESTGANAIFLMTTAQYSFDKYIEFAQEIRRVLKRDTLLIANIGDLNKGRARKLKETGFAGIYHALRLGEGKDTLLKPEARLRTFQYAKEEGLKLGTCVEPVGTEHSVGELVEKMLITMAAEPVYSGAARRIPILNTELAGYGIVSETRMAHILAVVRLALSYDIGGNCTHEPNVIGAAAGANLFWAESGSNPRDTKERTETQRGMSVENCRKIFEEAEWKVLEGPSRFYGQG